MVKIKMPCSPHVEDCVTNTTSLKTRYGNIALAAEEGRGKNQKTKNGHIDGKKNRRHPDLNMWQTELSTGVYINERSLVSDSA